MCNITNINYKKKLQNTYLFSPNPNVNFLVTPVDLANNKGNRTKLG